MEKQSSFAILLTKKMPKQFKHTIKYESDDFAYHDVLASLIVILATYKQIVGQNSKALLQYSLEIWHQCDARHNVLQIDHTEWMQAGQVVPVQDTVHNTTEAQYKQCCNGALLLLPTAWYASHRLNALVSIHLKKFFMAQTKQTQSHVIPCLNHTILVYYYAWVFVNTDIYLNHTDICL